MNRDDILFFGTFNSHPWMSTWGIKWGPGGPPAQLVTGPEALTDPSYKVKYPAGGYNSDKSGSSFKCNFDLMDLPEKGYESLYLRYYLKFDKGFEFVKGGKLPGLVGGAANTGGRKPTGLDGWSARIMWRQDGKIVQYLYHPDQLTQYGDDIPWNIRGQPHFIPGRWHCVETYVQLNTPGIHNGMLRSWLDGELACEKTNIRYRDIASIKIDSFYFSTFHGGDDPSWAPSKDVYCLFDSFVIAKNYVGPDVFVKLRELEEQASTSHFADGEAQHLIRMASSVYESARRSLQANDFSTALTQAREATSLFEKAFSTERGAQLRQLLIYVATAAILASAIITVVTFIRRRKKGKQDGIT